jgi:phage protein U
MPTLVWLSLAALLDDRTSATCVAFAEALHTVSHDRLTRRLQADWSGQTRLELAFRTLFVGERGSLIIDGTVIPKPFATAIAGLAWVYASQARRAVYGLSAQRHHLPGCLVAFCLLERERQDGGLTISTRKRQLSCQGHRLVLPALERIRPAA